jgi:aspartate racemase
MKTLGLIGGMSWESTLLYYRIINQLVNERLGGLHSAKMFLYSNDFQQINYLQKQNRWQDAGNILAEQARALCDQGAEAIVLCTNTMHRVASTIEDAIDNIPLLHIVDPTAEAIKRKNMRTIGLLGTHFTMGHSFFSDRLHNQYGLRVLTPSPEDRDTMDGIIYSELCRGEIFESSRKAVHQIIDRLVDDGAEGIILGCTEITMLISQSDTQTPLFDTTTLHAQSAAAWALSDEDVG